MRDVIVSLIFQILQLLNCVCKRDYGLGTEITKENLVRGSAEERQEKTKCKAGISLGEIVYRFWLLNNNQW